MYCLIDNFTQTVIPAKAGIQRNKDWIPHQVRNDTSRSIKKCYRKNTKSILIYG